MSQPFVSLIIPTLGREEELVGTLQSVLACQYPAGRWEVLVVDQTKQHRTETQEFLERLAREKKIRLYRPPEIGFASLTKARNFGLDAASPADIFLFVDDDVLVGADFIERHAEAYADPTVGATVGRVTVPGQPLVGPEAPAGRISWFGAFVDNYSSLREQDVDTFIGCNFSLRAAILGKTGRFEELFKGNALREDSDFAVRVTRAGFHIRFLPQAGLVHLQAAGGGTRSQSDRIKWYRALFYNNFLFYRRFAEAWRLPFFVLHMWRPILACSFWYGKGRPAALLAPWQGMAEGVRAARRSLAGPGR